VSVFKDAIASGYRLFDCAQFYHNEEYLGRAIVESGVPREEFFLISKIWTDNIFAGRDAIRRQLDSTLHSLQTTYLDLYLIHWPVPGKHVKAYQVLEELAGEGKTLGLGLSNYTIEDYEELVSSIGGFRYPPLVNQIEVSPFLYRKKTISYFQDKGIQILAYRLLRRAMEEFVPDILIELSTKYQKKPAQILGRWCLQKNMGSLPKSSRKERMEENKDIFGFVLSGEDEEVLDDLTTEEAREAFASLYRTCVVRDTPLSVSDCRASFTIN